MSDLASLRLQDLAWNSNRWLRMTQLARVCLCVCLCAWCKDLNLRDEEIQRTASRSRLTALNSHAAFCLRFPSTKTVCVLCRQAWATAFPRSSQPPAAVLPKCSRAGRVDEGRGGEVWRRRAVPKRVADLQSLVTSGAGGSA